MCSFYGGDTHGSSPFAAAFQLTETCTETRGTFWSKDIRKDYVSNHSPRIVPNQSEQWANSNRWIALRLTRVLADSCVKQSTVEVYLNGLGNFPASFVS